MTENTTIKLPRYRQPGSVVIEKLAQDDPLRNNLFSPVAKVSNGAELWGIEELILIGKRAFEHIERVRKFAKESGPDYNRQSYEKREPYFDIAVDKWIVQIEERTALACDDLPVVLRENTLVLVSKYK